MFVPVLECLCFFFLWCVFVWAKPQIIKRLGILKQICQPFKNHRAGKTLSPGSFKSENTKPFSAPKNHISTPGFLSADL